MKNRDINILKVAQGELNLTPRIVKAKKGKGSFSKKIKHKNESEDYQRN